MRTVSIAAALLVGVSGSAFAGGVIATPALGPPTGGYVRCVIANVSTTKTVTFDRDIYDFTGASNFSIAGKALQPGINTSNAAFANDDRQSHCVLRNVKGGVKNLRVALEVYDSSDAVVAAVSGR